MEKKILVADDSLTIQKVVELTFVDSDYRLTCVSNGRLALEKIREEPPDLVLADVVMPEKNGYEVCEEIKKNPATASIPVILLAGTFEPFDRERAKRLGCDAIVSKPFDSRELFRIVESLVAARTGGSAPGERPDWTAAPERTTQPPAAAAAEERSDPNPFTAAPPNPFDAGFVEEDFTGSIRTLRAGRGEPLAHLYGPDDVESALAAFRDVEPTARATDWRDAGPGAEPPAARPTRESGARYLDEGAEPGDRGEPEERTLPTAAEDNRTLRIDVSSFRAPRFDDEHAAGESAAEAVTVEPLPPQPLDLPPRREAPGTVDVAASSESVSSTVAAGAAPARDLSDADLDRLAEKLAAKVVDKLSERIVREVAWEVVPETAELVVRERLRELESGVD
jgi:CheY-like chemotaxis protein